MTEQGLGDIIQFIRFVPFLRDQGVNVSLCAPSRLGPLIQSSAIDSLPQDPDQLSHLADGFWTPLLSIPRHLEVSPTNPVRFIQTILNRYDGVSASEISQIVGKSFA